jgi:hypothetical protein
MSARRSDWLGSFAFAAAATVAWGAWLALDHPALLALALAVHAVAGGLVYYTASRERRALAAALAACVPAIGPIAAVLLEATPSRGGADLLGDLVPSRRRLDAREIARRITASLPPCEAILSGDAEARRATIARLVARAGAEDVAILRWARRQEDSDISVEAALALEEIGERFEQRLRAARAAASAGPTAAAHAAIVTVISEGVCSGIVDGVVLPELVAEARRHHLIAVVQDPSLTEHLAIAIARIELAARQPARALAVLSSVTGAPSPELVELRREAAYAARHFEQVSSAAAGKVALGSR